MILRHLALAATSIGILSACGGGGTPCSGSTCLQVSGTYIVTFTQTLQSSCKFITYNSANQAELQVTQSGSKVTVQFSNSPVAQSETGTLNTNGTAVFTASGQINVIDDQGGSFEYDDSNTLDLTFASASDGGMVSVSGQVSDTLEALMPAASGDPDPDCILDASVSGSD